MASGNFVCLVFFEEIKNIDGFQCFLEQAAAFLFYIYLDYICMALLLLVALISIFCGIKENYRWFILNQAIWDIFVIYNAICNFPYDEITGNFPMCFYSIRPENNSIFDFLLSSFFILLKFFIQFAKNYIGHKFSARENFSSTNFQGTNF